MKQNRLNPQIWTEACILFTCLCKSNLRAVEYEQWSQRCSSIEQWRVLMCSERRFDRLHWKLHTEHRKFSCLLSRICIDSLHRRLNSDILPVLLFLPFSLLLMMVLLFWFVKSYSRSPITSSSYSPIISSGWWWVGILASLCLLILLFLLLLSPLSINLSNSDCDRECSLTGASGSCGWGNMFTSIFEWMRF